jgi:hypothetical protein
VDSKGGTKREFGKRELYTATALLVMVFVAAGALFAVPAWSQNSSGDSQRDRNASEKQKQTQSSSKRTTDSSDGKLPKQDSSTRQAAQAALQAQVTDDLDGEEADESGGSEIESIDLDVDNCDVDTGDSMTFAVVSGPDSGDGDDKVASATVIDGINANIFTSNNGDTITVEEIGDSNGPIQFFIERNNGNLVTKTLSIKDELEVDTSTINCGNNNNGNNNNNRNNRHRDRVRDFLRNNNPFLDQYADQSDLEDAESDLDSINDENSTLESDQSGEDTLGNGSGNGSGVSANADENGAEASTPGAVASANGDEDTLPPVSGPQGNVVDEVPTSGPLPNTGGVPVATGTVLALVLFGAGLLVVRLVMSWRDRRT